MSKRIQSILSWLGPNHWANRSSQGRQRSLLRMLLAGQSEDLDAKTLIGNLASEYPDAFGRKLARLATWIDADIPLGIALAHTPGVLEPDDVLAIQVGAETGSLDETYRFLLSQKVEADDSSSTAIIRNTLGYVLVVAFFAILAITFLMVLIVPQILEIFDEFELAVPTLMSVLVEFSQSLLVIVALLFLILAGICVLLLFEDIRRIVLRSPWCRFFPTIRARRNAGILQLLALQTRLGKPIGDVLTAAAQFHPDPIYRQRLLNVRTMTRSGEDVWSNLARQRLISGRQSEQLAKISTPSLRSWTLATLAKQTRRRADQTTLSLVKVGQHLPVLALGVLVGWVVVAVMQTLVGLAQSLA